MAELDSIVDSYKEDHDTQAFLERLKIFEPFDIHAGVIYGVLDAYVQHHFGKPSMTEEEYRGEQNGLITIVKGMILESAVSFLGDKRRKTSDFIYSLDKIDPDMYGNSIEEFAKSGSISKEDCDSIISRISKVSSIEEYISEEKLQYSAIIANTQILIENFKLIKDSI